MMTLREVIEKKISTVRREPWNEVGRMTLSYSGDHVLPFVVIEDAATDMGLIPRQRFLLAFLDMNERVWEEWRR